MHKAHLVFLSYPDVTSTGGRGLTFSFCDSPYTGRHSDPDPSGEESMEQYVVSRSFAPLRMTVLEKEKEVANAG